MKMWRILTGVVLVVLLAMVSEVRGQNQGYREEQPYAWPVTEFPDPHSLDPEQQRRCGRDIQSSVCDPDGIISKFEAFQIDKAIEDVYENTTCRCFECQQRGKGYIIRVAIMPRMRRIFPNAGNSSYTRLRDAQMYSYILTTRWGMSGLCNETMLILFSKYDDILYTLTRELTSTVISDNAIKRISLGVRSYFDRDDTISQGILEIIRRYRAILLRGS